MFSLIIAMTLAQPPQQAPQVKAIPTVGCQCGCVTTGKCTCPDCDHPQKAKNTTTSPARSAGVTVITIPQTPRVQVIPLPMTSTRTTTTTQTTQTTSVGTVSRHTLRHPVTRIITRLFFKT